MSYVAEGMRLLSYLLRDLPEIKVDCYIFQSYSEEYGKGVCRGVIQYYTASYIDSVSMNSSVMISECRRKLANLNDKSNVGFFKSLQDDFKHHGSKVVTEDDLATVLSLGRMTGQLQNTGAEARSIFHHFRSYFSGKGIYHLALNKHSVAIVNYLGIYRFIDPNTCEFSCSSLQIFCDFLSRYYNDFILGDVGDGPIAFTVWYRLS